MKQLKISEIAEKFTSHPTIKKFTDLPSFPTMRIEWLRTQITKYACSSIDGERFALAASLLQHGLDTHDEVAIHNEAQDLIGFRSLQLKVLAGDYFSSRFYECLANAGDIKFISKLAQAVCHVNFLKIDLHQAILNAKLSADEYLDRMTQLRLPVFQCFRAWIPETLVSAWDDTMYSLTFCEVIWNELQSLHKPRRFVQWYILEHGSRDDQSMLRSGQFDMNWFQSLVDKYHLVDWLSRKLEYHANRLEQLIRSSKDETMERDWLTFSVPLTRFLSTMNAVN